MGSFCSGFGDSDSNLNSNTGLVAIDAAAVAATLIVFELVAESAATGSKNARYTDMESNIVIVGVKVATESCAIQRKRKRKALDRDIFVSRKYCILITFFTRGGWNQGFIPAAFPEMTIGTSESVVNEKEIQVRTNNNE